MPTVISITAQANDDVRCHLQAMTALHKRLRTMRANAPYACIEEFVLRHGQAFSARVSPPDGLWPGIPHLCFQNSAILATVCPERWTYVEGFAIGVIPVHHAWVMDAQGRVVDITWPEELLPEHPPAYVGVAFNTAYVKRTVMGGLGCVLDNYRERFPLLTGAHTLKQALYQPESEAAR